VPPSVVPVAVNWLVLPSVRFREPDITQLMFPLELFAKLPGALGSVTTTVKFTWELLARVREPVKMASW
jgi:hypothetical protein